MKPEKNLSQVRNVWKRQQRDKRGRFAKFEIFDYSADKMLVDTLVQASDQSSHQRDFYTLDDIRKAFYEGANGSTMFTLSKRFEIYCKKNNYML